MAAITFLAEDTPWVKSITGGNFKKLPRLESACSITITKKGVHEIKNMTEHPVLKSHRLVAGDAGLRYYAGVPLINKDGFALGALCVLDRQPKKLDPEKLNILSLLGRDVMAHLEQRKNSILQNASVDHEAAKFLQAQVQLEKQEETIREVKRGFDKQTSLFQSILNNSPQLIALLDEDGKYRLVNSAAIEFFNRPAGDIIGKSFMEIYDDQKIRQQKKALIEQVLRTGAPSSTYEVVHISSGEKQYFQTLMIPVEDEDMQKAVISISTNVSEIKKMESTLNQKNLELEKLIYSISHDLRGPISSILGLLNVEKYSGDIDMREYFELIYGQALKMDASIHDLVQLKNVTNKNLQPAVVDIEELLQDVLENHKDQGAAVTFSGAQGVELKSDFFFLQSAVDRVLANAVQFHQNNAQSPQVHIEVERKEDKVEITITDNGVGIRQEALPRIFEMFYRGSILSQGQGLGLYITQRALQRIKASISVNSVEGKGTTVTLSIPDIEGEAFY